MVEPLMARPISQDSWLQDPTYSSFRTACAYASLKTRAIPGLAVIEPEDAYYVWLFIQRGMSRQEQDQG